MSRVTTNYSGGACERGAQPVEGKPVLGVVFGLLLAALAVPTATTSCEAAPGTECAACDKAYLHQCSADTYLGEACTDDSDGDAACDQEYPGHDPPPTSDTTPCTDIPIGTSGDWGSSGDGSDETAFNFCAHWDPAANVSFSSSTGKYTVDGPWFDAVVADPRPLVHCDDATVEYYYFSDPRTGTLEGYKVENASSGELLYELGLRNNEVITEINGNTVTSYSNAAELLFDLYHDQGLTSYTVTVDCIFSCSGSYPATLSYDLDYP